MYQYTNSSDLIVADPSAAPPASVVRALRRGGFWASFLGWASVAFMVGVLGLGLVISQSQKPRYIKAATKASVTQTAELNSAKPIASLPIKESELESPKSSSIQSLMRAITLASLLAALTMIILLVRFGSATRKLSKAPSFSHLEKILQLQHILWVCIGTYSGCSILGLVVLIYGHFMDAAAVNPLG